MEQTVAKYERAALCGAKIRDYRKKRGWKLKDLARESGFGVAYIGHVEKGLVNIPLETLLTIADALEVCPTELLSEVRRGDGKQIALRERAKLHLMHTKDQLAVLSQDLDELLVHG